MGVRSRWSFPDSATGSHVHDLDNPHLVDQRDFHRSVGVLTGAVLLLGVGDNLEAIGAGIIAAFMAAALVMHLKVKNPLVKLMPSIGLGAGAVLVLWHHRG